MEPERAAFLAWKLITHDPRMLRAVLRHDGARFTEGSSLVQKIFYPHVAVVGDLIPEERIHEGWRRAAALARAGDAPASLGVYVHYPFCAARCAFCFCAMTTRLAEGRPRRYVANLRRDMGVYGSLLDHWPVSSVYLGGGTPSLMGVEAMELLFTGLHEHFRVAPDVQITMEVNPDSTGQRKLEVMARVGRVNRITVGVQTLDPEAQRRANRFNGPEDVSRVVRSATELGMHVSVDLMAGLDGQSLESFQRDVEFVLGLEPDSVHLSGFRPVIDARSRDDEEQLARRQEMLEWGNRALAAHGLLGRRGMPPTRSEGSVNRQLLQWREESASLLGLGAGAFAHSFGGHFYEVTESVAAEAGMDRSVDQLAAEGARQLRAVPATLEEEACGFLVQNLMDGFALGDFQSMFGAHPRSFVGDRWDRLFELGALEEDGVRVRSLVGDHASRLIYGMYVYSPHVEERMWRLWGADFRRDESYEERVRDLASGCR